MNCCSNCFIDDEVVAFIKLNSTQKGNCDYCSNKDVQIVPASELSEIFEELMLSYVPIKEATTDALYLYQQIYSWDIFNKSLGESDIKNIVLAIGSQLHKENPDLFEQLTIPEIFSNQETKLQAEDYTLTWGKFKDEIKSVNRFFIQNVFESQKVRDILKYYDRTYKKGKIFYRARNSDSIGWSKDEMGKPPSTSASPGRANPHGISYLYLANDIKTTLYEVRAAIYDYVTVAEFILSNEINVVSLRTTKRFSPFKMVDNIGNYLLYERFVQALHQDLKKPLRKQDSELEYLPTQYLCELIKYLGYDGVEYGSSMNPDGFNIALFSQDKVMCSDTNIYEVESLSYNYSLVATNSSPTVNDNFDISRELERSPRARSRNPK